jgi:alpha-tubulin suppressor-like RCC1 family protein
MPGAESTLAQRADGQYFGWGRNTQGEVGTATTPITTPTPVSALTGATTVVMAEHGNFNLTFACGIFGASATVKCWGNNSAGQLGNGTTTSSPSPTNVSGLSDVAQLSLTTTGTACALTRAGAVKCWGDATGDGTTLRRFLPVDLAL